MTLFQSQGECKFFVGFAAGGTWKRIGRANTDDECAALVTRKEPSANGATWDSDVDSSTGGGCFAEFGAIGKTIARGYRTCLFKGQ